MLLSCENYDINMQEKQSREFDICVESKITKKTYHYVNRQIELVGLIHIDLAKR